VLDQFTLTVDFAFFLNHCSCNGCVLVYEALETMLVEICWCMAIKQERSGKWWKGRRCSLWR